MHLRIPFLLEILGRTGCLDDGGIHDSPRLPRNPCSARYSPIRAKSRSPNWWASSR
jgi:hypothetical protein